MQNDHTTLPTFITLSPRARDITGQRFGRLVALGPISHSPKIGFLWLCQCDCGKSCNVGVSNLRRSHTQSCGCLWIETQNIVKDMTGQRFGRFVALSPAGLNKQGCMTWLCQCDCGNLKTISGSNLRMGNTLSCGCHIREVTSRRSTIHGKSHTKLYVKWRRMIQRCTDPNDIGYADYGGRGITVCDEWRHDFVAFCGHVSRLPHCGEKGYTLDRVDNEGNYEPGNIRWATQTDQNRNRRISRMITYQGKTQCLQAWEEELGFRKGTLQHRLDRGWAIEKAMTQTVARNGRRKNE